MGAAGAVAVVVGFLKQLYKFPNSGFKSQVQKILRENMKDVNSMGS
jgi:glutaredoxin-related protein